VATVATSKYKQLCSRRVDTVRRRSGVQLVRAAPDLAIAPEDALGVHEAARELRALRRFVSVRFARAILAQGPC